MGARYSRALLGYPGTKGVTAHMKKLWWFSCGMLVGLSTLTASMASVPSHVTDDTVLYQNLRELREQKQKDLSFERDIQKLASLEDRYREPLPSVYARDRLQGPMKRISSQRYRPSVKKKGAVSTRR